MAIPSYLFVREKKDKWEELAALLDKIRWKGFTSLPHQELIRLGDLYQDTTGDLAYAKTHFKDYRLHSYLNNLVAKAHSYIYQSKSFKFAMLKNFFTHQFPALFSQLIRFIIPAGLIFFLFCFLGFFFSFQEEEFVTLLIPSSILGKVEQRQMWTDDITTIAPLASSSIMTNNISVSIVAFALGITLGIGTVYILALNGLLFGTIVYLAATNNLGLQFLSFVLPHGIIELTIIFIASGAGFVIASAELFPGELKRKDALVRRGRDAVRLLLGSLPFLVVAGIIEGFISPSILPPCVKITFAVLAGSLFFLYLFSGVRS